MPLVQTRYNDPLTPVLLSSEVLEVSEEQRTYIREILDITSSDSRSAQKAYAAIQYVLTGGSVVIPIVTSLTPSTAVLGSPSFTLHVVGTGFGAYSTIVWNGSTEPTTIVSDTEVTTEVDMSTAEVAMQIPVAVQTGDGVLSNAMIFTLTEAGLMMAKKVNAMKQDHVVETMKVEKK